MKIKLSQPFKHWLVGTGVIISLLLFIAFKCFGNDPIMWGLTWALIFVGVASYTLLLGLTTYQTNERERQRQKTGEAAPYFRKEYKNGEVLAFRDTVLIKHGCNRVRVDTGEFLTLAHEIGEAWKKA